MDTLKQLLHMGANARQVDHEGHNLLHFAASCRKEFCAPRVDILKALLTVNLAAKGGETTNDEMSGAQNDGNAMNMRDATSDMLASASKEAADMRARTQGNE